MALISGVKNKFVSSCWWNVKDLAVFVLDYRSTECLDMVRLCHYRPVKMAVAWVHSSVV